MYQIIYIPGVFDLLHSGHFNLFYRSKLLFPRSKIIIGLCSDEVCLQTKRLPQENQNIRFKKIKLLDIIEDVLIYNNLDQSYILQIIEPTILIIPPDYGKYPEHKKTIEFAQSKNIVCLTIPRTKNISTTQIINNEI